MKAPIRTATTVAKVSSPAPWHAAFIQRKCACGKPRGVTDECEECRKGAAERVQRKPVMNAPGDRWEREADRIAEIVTGPRSDGALPCSPSPRITPVNAAALQRDVASAAHASIDSPAGALESLDSLDGRGHPLDTASRGYFESKFGHDFSRIRIHSDSRATQMATAAGARAFTAGHHIVFNSGDYAPYTSTGRRLIAHELAHTLQQRTAVGQPGALVQRAPKEQCGPDFLFEFDAVINEKPLVRGVPRVYYQPFPTKSDPGKRVEPIVAQKKLPAGQLSPDGFWRAVCHDPAEQPAQILWVLKDYVSKYEPPKEKKPSAEETERKRQTGERTRLEQATSTRHRRLVEGTEDSVLGWGHLTQQARKLTPTDPARAEELLRFVWARVDPITQNPNLDEKLRGLDGLTRTQLRQLVLLIRDGFTQLLRSFGEGRPPHEGLWKTYFHWTTPTQQLLGYLNGETAAHDTPLVADLQAVNALSVKVWAAVGAAILTGPFAIKLAFTAGARLWILSYANPVLTSELAPFIGAGVIQIIATGEIPMSPMDLIELWVIVRGARGTAGRPRRVKGRVKERRGDKIDIQLEEPASPGGSRVTVPRGAPPKSMVGAAPQGFAPDTGLVSVSAPKAVPHRNNLITTPDPRLLELARDERITQAGVTREAFDAYNIAVARVRVDGKVEYLSAGNLPKKQTVPEEGIHSEEYLLVQIHSLRQRGKKVVLEQLYSERIPCSAKCMDLLKAHFPEAQIFFSVGVPQPGVGRGERVMEAYDVEPLD